MATLKGLASFTSDFSSRTPCNSKPVLAFSNLRPNTANTFTSTGSRSKRVFLAHTGYRKLRQFGPINATPIGRNHQNIKFDDGYTNAPFFLKDFKQGISAIKMVFGFLVEQPSQLKHIEWPCFGSTLKTSTLTLILVALLIVALSTVDSVLSFLLALVLRKKA